MDHCKNLGLLIMRKQMEYTFCQASRDINAKISCQMEERMYHLLPLTVAIGLKAHLDRKGIRNKTSKGTDNLQKERFLVDQVIMAGIPGQETGKKRNG